MKKVLIGSALGLVALLALAAVAALTYRALWQHRIAAENAITTAYGIDEARYVDIHGAREWITIRAQDRRKPVILFLHGGPSEANSPLIPLYRPFEHDYVFVQWDQPGAGMTAIAAGDHPPALTIEHMVEDGIAVAESVHGELHPPRIILIGQDFGGLIGLRMIGRRPDLFSAFVGTGQIVGTAATGQWLYQDALARATAGHDVKMLAALRQVGPPPYRTRESFGGLQTCCRTLPAADAAGIRRLMAMLAFSPDLSIRQVFGWYRALRSGEDTLDRTLMTMRDLRETDIRFSAPVFFIQGADDNITPTSLVAGYVSRIEAPATHLDIIPDAGHFVMWTHPAAFLDALDKDLRAAVRPPGQDTAAPDAR